MSVIHNVASTIEEFLISAITAGVAVILTIFTVLSTPILTKIFGDGSLEVCIDAKRSKIIKALNQGEDTEDWAYHGFAAEEEEVVTLFKLKQ